MKLIELFFPVLSNTVYCHWRYFVPDPFLYYHQCEECSIYTLMKDVETANQMVSIHNKEFHQKGIGSATKMVSVSIF